MRGADVFCAPSLRGESFGVVLLEAMAAETPVVASDLPGYANVARLGPRRPAGPARATPTCWPTPSDGCSPIRPRRPAYVASGEQRARELSMERLAERYLELYENRDRRRRGAPHG